MSAWTRRVADKLRNNTDAAEYKHVVLGLIFLKYISDAFEEQHASLQQQTSDPQSEWYVKEESAFWREVEWVARWCTGTLHCSRC